MCWVHIERRQHADGVETGNCDRDKSRAVAVAHGFVRCWKQHQVVCGVHIGPVSLCQVSQPTAVATGDCD